MANDDKENEEEDNSKEVFHFLNSCSKDELVKALFDMFQIEHILIDEKKVLKDRIHHYVEGYEDYESKLERLSWS